MQLNRHSVVVPAGALLILGWLVLLLVWPDYFPRFEDSIVNFLLGTLYGLNTVAAAWLVLGPGPFLLRLPASIVLVLVNVGALLLNCYMHGEPIDGDFFPIFAACNFAQWLLVQLPLWLVSFAYGVRLRYLPGATSETKGRSQYGIRQLLILTTIVAVVLAVGRMVIMSFTGNHSGGDWMMLGFLNLAAVAVSLPVLLAALLPRFAVLAVGGVAVLVCLFTIWEDPIRQQLAVSGGPPGASFGWLNAVTCFWALAFVICVRLCGYGIGAPKPSVPVESFDMERFRSEISGKP